MAIKSVMAVFAALMSIAAWIAPSGVIGDTHPSPHNAATSMVAAKAPTTEHLGLPTRTPPRTAPTFKVESVAQLVKSAPRTKTVGAIFRGGVTPKARPSRPAVGGTVQTPKTVSAPRIAVYNGLNQAGIASGDNANLVTPPDSTGAIGPANYVEIVNSEIAVFSRSNLPRLSMSTLHDLIGDTGDTPDPYCDVQVQWDPSANRWLFSFLFCNTSSSVQFVVFGWSKTSDPSDLVSGWCAFGLSTGTSLFDYPKLGHNSNYIIIGGNFYDESFPTPNPPFQTAAIAWITKPASGLSTCPDPSTLAANETTGPLLNGDGSNTFTPVPVNTFSGSGDGYIVSAYDPSGSNNQTPGARTKLAIWHLDSLGVLHPHSDITVASFTYPSPAPQLGSANTIDTLDGRLTQAVGDPATGIWTSHTVDGPGGRSVLDWYEIKVSGTTASLAQQGIIASATDFVFNGAISPRFDHGGAAVFYNRSSSSIDPLIAAQERLTSTAAGAMEPGELVLATSTSPATDFSCSGAPCRWGDYSGASPDPVQTNLVWGTNQILASSVGSNPAWATENFAVTFLETPTNVTAVAGDQSAAVTWTPAPVDPGTPITGYTLTSYDGVLTHAISVAAPASSMVFPGLTNGVTYTFTVIANSASGSSVESAHSNPVTPSPRDLFQASPPPMPTRSPVSQASAAPTPSGR